jgi:hypothetical protein
MDLFAWVRLLASLLGLLSLSTFDDLDSKMGNADAGEILSALLVFFGGNCCAGLCD